MDSTGSPQINNYANAMFRLEELNSTWLKACTNYVRFIFGETIRGKTVVDYAFGRGNWSIAFINAGAKRVIAIDASMDNVKRFEEYCHHQKLSNIKVVMGNALHDSYKFKCDLLWLYGILHHIKDLDLFLSRVKPWMKYEESPLYIYYYNKNSLRETIVEICRRLLLYKSEKEFIDDNYLFLRNAKIRASDDLVAPYISWKTALELRDTLNKNGIYVHRQDIDFYEYNTGVVNADFYPHQFLCSQKKEAEAPLNEREQEYSQEIKLISIIAEDVVRSFKGSEERQKIAIGLYNAHFAYLGDMSDLKESLIEVFLFLMRLLFQSKSFKQTNFTQLVEHYYQLLVKTMSDACRDKEANALGGNLFTDYLLKNRIRL